MELLVLLLTQSVSLLGPLHPDLNPHMFSACIPSVVTVLPHTQCLAELAPLHDDTESSTHSAIANCTRSRLKERDIHIQTVDSECKSKELVPEPMATAETGRTSQPVDNLKST